MMSLKTLLQSRHDRRLVSTLLSSQKSKANCKNKEFFLLPFAFLVSTALPVKALQVQVAPNNPQLGDTLSVVIQTDSPGSQSPTVSFKQKTYRAFSLGQNRFRVLLPTTPLDKPGTLKIRVAGDGEVKNLS